MILHGEKPYILPSFLLPEKLPLRALTIDFRKIHFSIQAFHGFAKCHLRYVPFVIYLRTSLVGFAPNVQTYSSVLTPHGFVMDFETGLLGMRVEVAFKSSLGS